MEERMVKLDTELHNLKKENKELEKEAHELEDVRDTLKREVERDRETLRALKEEALEIKMHRIAMEEITRCSWESLLRSMGYVKSFYGYPDMANKENKETETEDSE